MGSMGANFHVTSQRMNVTFDRATQQQQLCFNFVLTVSIPQLLQELINSTGSTGGAREEPAAQGPPGLQVQPLSNRQDQSSKLPGERQQQMFDPISTTWEPLRAALPGAQQRLRSPQPVQVPKQSLQSRVAPHPQQSRTSSWEADCASLPLPPSRRSSAPQLPPASNSSRMGDISALADGSCRSEEASSNGARMSDPLEQAALSGDVQAVRDAVQQGANLNRRVTRAGNASLLHCVLESGCKLEMVQFLLKSLCDVNAITNDKRTPLHLAIAHHSQLPPMAERMLLCARADVHAQDATGTRPLDQAELLAKCILMPGGRQPTSVSADQVRVRQLLQEITDESTVAIHVVEKEKVLGALFADPTGSKVAFFTESTVGIYSVEAQTVSLKQKLLQAQMKSVVRSIAVSPELGSVVVFVEVVSTTSNGHHTVQNLIIIWPSGQLQEEEPLKLNVESAGSGSLPPAIFISTGTAPQILLGRVCDGKVLCWRLNRAGSQVVGESKLVDNGGLLALSPNGRWMAVVDRSSPNGGEALQVFTFEDSPSSQAPKGLMAIDRRPLCMAIADQPVSASHGAVASCLLALQQPATINQPVSPIEILSVKADGAVSVAYTLRLDSPRSSLCTNLSFCSTASNFLLSRNEHGLVIVYDLETQQVRKTHDDLRISSIAISDDRKLLVTAVGGCLRVHRFASD